VTCRPTRLIATLALLAALPACQQKMAKQPYYRPYDESKFFDDKQSARPLAAGVIARGQPASNSLLVSGLTAEGRKVAPDRERMPSSAGDPGVNVPFALDVKNYVGAFPFEMTAGDLHRGSLRYTAFCVECHGVLGNGGGKIVERGFLRPPSYHAVQLVPDEPGDDLEKARGHQRGYSRGFARWGKDVRLDEVPVGYIFEVITNGYGGMAEHGTQIPAADRWRIAAYVRTLQFSRNSTAAHWPAAAKDAAKEAPKNAETKGEGHK